MVKSSLQAACLLQLSRRSWQGDRLLGCSRKAEEPVENEVGLQSRPWRTETDCHYPYKPAPFWSINSHPHVFTMQKIIIMPPLKSDLTLSRKRWTEVFPHLPHLINTHLPFHSTPPPPMSHLHTTHYPLYLLPNYLFYLCGFLGPLWPSFDHGKPEPNHQLA